MQPQNSKQTNAEKIRKNIEKAIIDDTVMDKITTKYTHVNIHTGQSLTQDIDRILTQKKDAQSRFIGNIHKPEDTLENQQQAEFLIKEALLFNAGTIAEWLDKTDDYTNKAFTTHFPEDDYGVVGSGMVFNHQKHTIKEYQSEYMKLVLKKDPKQPLGVALVSAFPEIEQHDIKPTNKDLACYVKDTNAYKNADDVGKIYLHYITDVKNENLVTYTRGRTPDDSAMLLHIETNNPNVRHEIRIKEHSVTMRTVMEKYENHKSSKSSIQTDYTRAYAKITGRDFENNIDLKNPKIFEMFSNDYPDIAKNVKTIIEHLDEKTLAEKENTKQNSHQTMKDNTEKSSKFKFDVTKNISDKNDTNKNHQNQHRQNKNRYTDHNKQQNHNNHYHKHNNNNYKHNRYENSNHQHNRKTIHINDTPKNDDIDYNF